MTRLGKIFSAIIVSTFILSSGPIAAADDDGYKVPFPKGYRDWTHVKSMVIFSEKHPLYGAFAGIHHIYADNKALKSLKGSKDFPKGAMFAFDLLAIDEASGAYTESKRKFVAVMVRDAKKYKDTKGWGWQAFADGDPKKPQLNTMASQKACATCHTEVNSKYFVFVGWRP